MFGIYTNFRFTHASKILKSKEKLIWNEREREREGNISQDCMT